MGFGATKGASASNKASSVYSCSGASYVGASDAVTLGEHINDTARSMVMHPNGLKFWLGSNRTDAVYEFTMSTKDTISSTNVTPTVIDFNADLPDPGTWGATGIAFSSNGSRFYICYSADTETVYQWTLAAPWDLSSPTLVAGTVDPNRTGVSVIAFTDDGRRISALNRSSTNLTAQYLLSTPWDLNTAGSTEGTSTAFGHDRLSSGVISGNGRYFYSDGRSETDLIYLETIDTQNDLQDGGTTSHSTFDRSTQFTGTVGAIALSNDGKNIYLGNDDDDIIRQYTLGAKVA